MVAQAMSGAAAASAADTTALALCIVREREGRLPDDTYLAKLADRLAERLSSGAGPGGDGEAKELCHVVGEFLGDALRPPLSTTRAGDFALDVLCKCLESGGAAKSMAEPMVRGLLDPWLGDLLSTTTGLQLLLAALRSLPVVSRDLLRVGEPVVLLWRGCDGDGLAAANMFWLRALEDLTMELVDRVMMKGDGDAEEQEKELLRSILQLAETNKGVQKLATAYAKRHFARGLADRGNQSETGLQFALDLVCAASRYPKSSGADRVYLEVLRRALEDVDDACHFVCEALQDWCVPGHHQNRDDDLVSLLKAASFVSRTLSLHPQPGNGQEYGDKEIRAREAFRKLTAKLGEILGSELTDPDSTFEKSYLILCHASDLLAVSANCSEKSPLASSLRQLLVAFLDRTDSMKRPTLLLQRLLDVQLKGLCGLTVQGDWQTLKSLLLESSTSERNQAKLVKVMALVLQEDTASHHNRSELFQEMWRVLDRGLWDSSVKDEFLQLLAAAAKRGHHTLEEFDDDVLRRALYCAGDKDSRIRSSACDVLRVFAERHPDKLTLEVSALERLLLQETEAEVRRSAARLASKYFSAKPLTTEAARVMLEALLDLDTDTKVEVFDFWLDRLNHLSVGEGQEDSLHDNDKAIMCALSLVMKDPDLTFRVVVEERLQRFQSVLQVLSDSVEKTVKDLSDRDDCREATTEAHNHKMIDTRGKIAFSRREFLAAYLEYQARPPAKLIQEQFCDLQMGLESVLADIIQSVSPANKIEGPDCV